MRSAGAPLFRTSLTFQTSRAAIGSKSWLLKPNGRRAKAIPDASDARRLQLAFASDDDLFDPDTPAAVTDTLLWTSMRSPAALPALPAWGRKAPAASSSG